MLLCVYVVIPTFRSLSNVSNSFSGFVLRNFVVCLDATSSLLVFVFSVDRTGLVVAFSVRFLCNVCMCVCVHVIASVPKCDYLCLSVIGYTIRDFSHFVSFPMRCAYVCPFDHFWCVCVCVQAHTRLQPAHDIAAPKVCAFLSAP